MTEKETNYEITPPLDLSKLKEPFPAKDIEWRVQRSGVKDGKPWAMVLAYVTNRAIMDRLDAVCGPENWKNYFEKGPDGGILCGISIKCGGEWVTKYDGAANTQVESVKGGLSSAQKRAGSQWGIGRYLYNLDVGFANISPGGKFSAKAQDDKQKNVWFKWDAPSLPAWALPAGEAAPPKITPPPIESPIKKILAKIAAFDDIDLFNSYVDKQWDNVELALAGFPEDLESAEEAQANKLKTLTEAVYND
jgi:hypothetical protein